MLYILVSVAFIDAGEVIRTRVDLPAGISAVECPVYAEMARAKFQLDADVRDQHAVVIASCKEQ